MPTSSSSLNACLCEPEPDFLEECRRRFRISSENWRLFLSETFCTAVFLFIGLNSVAQLTLSKANELKQFINVTLAWGFGLVLVVHMGYYISDAIRAYDNSKPQNDTLGAARIFATYPSAHISVTGAVADQILSTAVLAICVCLIGDPRTRIPAAAQPSLFGVTLALINFSFVLNEGCAMNPARDFMPRLFTYFAGYGSVVFSYNNYQWFWIPMLCPIIGALLGAWSYSLFIGFQLPDVPGLQCGCRKLRESSDQKEPVDCD